MTIKNPEAPATDAQMNFLHTLEGERGLPLTPAGTLNKGQASERIGTLKGTPKPKKGQQQAPAAALAVATPTATLAVPVPVPETQLALPPTPEPAPTTESDLVGKLLYIPFADSYAAVRVVADDPQAGLAYLVKADGVNPDNWTHPLVGEGPTRVERERVVALAK